MSLSCQYGKPIKEVKFHISNSIYVRTEWSNGIVTYTLNGKECTNAVLLKHVERYYQTSIRG